MKLFICRSITFSYEVTSEMYPENTDEEMIQAERNMDLPDVIDVMGIIPDADISHASVIIPDNDMQHIIASTRRIEP